MLNVDAVERDSQVEIVDVTYKAVLCRGLRGLLTNLCVSVTPRAKKVLCGINFDAVSISLTQRREGAEILDRSGDAHKND